jgi:hypothetical protein
MPTSQNIRSGVPQAASLVIAVAAQIGGSRSLAADTPGNSGMDLKVVAGLAVGDGQTDFRAYLAAPAM